MPSTLRPETQLLIKTINSGQRKMHYIIDLRSFTPLGAARIIFVFTSREKDGFLPAMHI